MRRREFVALLAGCLIWPALAKAQQAHKLPVVGVLWDAGSAEEEKNFSTPLRAGFSDLGYVEGKNIRFEERYPAEKKELFDKLATELVEMKVDVIVAGSIPAALAAQRATSSTHQILTRSASVSSPAYPDRAVISLVIPLWGSISQ